MKRYKISYSVDNGCEIFEDTALILADNADDARIKLKFFIESKDSETCIRQFFETMEFDAEIFTVRYGWCDCVSNDLSVYHIDDKDTYWGFVK